MATYRNTYTNYYSDKSGNHSPVGSILPVFVGTDQKILGEDPEYTYPQHLYCDGKELLIRDYPELYSIIENRYGGSESVEVTQAAQPGGLRRSYMINNKMFFQFYHDPTNSKANVKLPYPYGAVFRFALDPNGNPFGGFPSNGVFNQNTFYSLIQPTEDVSLYAAVNEFAYELVFPNSVDLTTVNPVDYTKNFASGSGNYTFTVTNNGQTSWTINGTDRNGNVSGNNPTLNFQDGDVAQFAVTTDDNHPFLIKTASSTGTGDQLPEKTINSAFGVNGNGAGSGGSGQTNSGTVTLYTATLSPTTLYYNCQNHIAMSGSIAVAVSTGGADTHPNIIVQRSFSLRDYPYNIGTFNLPDYRNRKILGFGNVNGAGTATPENAVNNFVGQTGGQWYIPKDTLMNSGEFFVIGDVKTTGYTDITADISAYITGSVKYQIGPMDDYVFPFPPTHNHRILSVEVDETKLAELGPTEVDKYAVNYINSRANINVFEPNGSAGGALGHSHGLIGRPLQNSQTATYGNTNGIGETAGDTGDAQYQYMVSESASVNVTSMTYDSNTGYITINTDGAHNLSVDDIVTVNGALPLEYSGNFTIIAPGFGAATFSVEPRTGETPTSSPATGTITVKLANGYFAETEIIDPPRAYVVDTSTRVGGKQEIFDIPGDAINIKEVTLDTPGSTVVTSPPSSAGDVTGMYITMQAPGGGGADSDTDGTAGGYAEIGLTIDGTFYTIRCYGGGGGQAGNSGGAGGTGGVLEVPAALLNMNGISITETPGGNGADGGMIGNGGGNDALGAIGFGGGGNGTAQAKEQVVNNPETEYTTNGSYQIPAASSNEISRSITIQVSGGGGGPGNANSGSNCSSTWSGWPTSISGKTGANGGYGGRGALLTGTMTANTGTFSWEIGQGGVGGFNTRQGNTSGGTPGIDPSTGNPWNDWPGGIGNGTEPGGDTPRVGGASGCLSGRGARGAWGNGATAGSGGGVTGFYYNGTLIAGAGGGGGGGGSGGGFNGSGTTDGCYKGGDARAAAQGLIATTAVLDVANGSNGSPGGCTAGGGGGGGSACGVINQANGGEGGTAGVGHNGNGGGSGGRRGISAYRTSFWDGGVSLTNNGSLPTIDGYVKIQLTTVDQYYDAVGGGGGQGAGATLGLNGVNATVTVLVGNSGQGGGEGGDALPSPNGGKVYVQYFGREEGTSVPGDITVPAGKYYECDSSGDPQGSPFDGDIWQSSTDDDIREAQFGPGTGDSGGFSGGNAIPFNTNGKITKYIPFTGEAEDAGGKRQLEVGALNLTDVNALRFTVIRGSNGNGGENPDQALNVFYKKGTSNNVTLFSQILLAANSTSTWQTIDLPIAEGDQLRANNITLILEQDRGPVYQTASGSIDNYGLGAITLFYAPRTVTTFVSTGGATLLGNLDVGGQPINSDDGIDQVRREVSAVDAALTVTDGVFTMSSSTPITTLATVSAEKDIPLITKYHRVKYLIKAL